MFVSECAVQVTLLFIVTVHSCGFSSGWQAVHRVGELMEAIDEIELVDTSTWEVERSWEIEKGYVGRKDFSQEKLCQFFFSSRLYVLACFRAQSVSHSNHQLYQTWKRGRFATFAR